MSGMWLNRTGGPAVADFRIEEDLLSNGYENIAGIDEAGRGALFGPVVAVSVMFPDDFIRGNQEAWVSEIDDSKLLTPKKRQRLAKAILATAKAIGIGTATNKEIDKINIRMASFEAMKRAVTKMRICPDFLLVDGFRIPGIRQDQLGLRHGDRRSISVASASIVAKVLRDQMVSNLDGVYEGYAFAKHKGYGTKDHFQALDEKGPTVFHRFSFRPLNQE
jgi:ribonuclease HII